MSASRTATRLGALVIAGAFVLTACSPEGGGGGGNGGGNGEAITDEQREEALSTPTQLTYWSWVPDIENQVALFEEAYPEIEVTVENVGQGLPHYQKLRSALEAGEGAPDVAQMQYPFLPSFVLSESLLDLTPYGAGEIADDYVGWAWQQVAPEDEQIWGIPQDVGPMANLYREDILAEAGIDEPPATWEEYAKAARAVKDETGAYISNLGPTAESQMIGFMWQRGAKLFGYDGQETVSINVNSAEAKDVATYWTELIQDDLISVDPDFTDQWYQGLANGKYAGWLTAAWGPIFLQGTAEDTSGLWRAAPLPQWATGGDESGNWGGSADSVLVTSENPIAAYELAKFINHNEESVMMLATEQFLYPAQLSVLENPEFIDQESEFYGGQQVNKLFAEISETVDTEWQWLPFTEYVFSSYEETIGPVIADKGDIAAALDDWQEQLVSYAEDQGFTVE